MRHDEKVRQNWEKLPKYIREHITALDGDLRQRVEYIDELEQGGRSNNFYVEDIRSGHEHLKRVHLPEYSRIGISVGKYNELTLREDRHNNYVGADYTLSATHGRLVLIPQGGSNLIGVRIEHG